MGPQCQARSRPPCEPGYRVSAQPAHISQRKQSLLPQAGPRTGRFQLNQAPCPGTEWAFTGPLSPRKTDPLAIWRCGELGGRVAGGQALQQPA